MTAASQATGTFRWLIPDSKAIYTAYADFARAGELIARGATARESAAQLGISPKTVGTHIERIYSKIGASTRSTAA